MSWLYMPKNFHGSWTDWKWKFQRNQLPRDWNKWVTAYQEAFQLESQEILHCASFLKPSILNVMDQRRGKLLARHHSKLRLRSRKGHVCLCTVNNSFHFRTLVKIHCKFFNSSGGKTVGSSKQKPGLDRTAVCCTRSFGGNIYTLLIQEIVILYRDSQEKANLSGEMKLNLRFCQRVNY